MQNYKEGFHRLAGLIKALIEKKYTTKDGNDFLVRETNKIIKELEG